MIIKDLFDFETGSLPALELTEEGNVPLVYGTTKNNGVVKFVKVYDEDQVFKPPCITVSYLGTAFVQVVSFTTSVVDKSNIIVLKSKKEMSIEELYFYATQINKHAQFGFHYGRRMNMKKLSKLEVQEFKKPKLKVDFKQILPKIKKRRKITHNSNYKSFNIMKYFDLKRGDFHALDRLDDGSFPTVSRITEDNGIVGYYDKPEDVEVCSKLRITVSTTSGDAFVQLNDFIATDNVVILEPKKDFKITTLFFIQLMINRTKWRYSYGRQCYKTKFARTNIYLPVDEQGEIDEDYIEQVVNNCYGWEMIEQYVT